MAPSHVLLLIVTRRGIAATEGPLDFNGVYPSLSMEIGGARLHYVKSIQYEFPNFSPLLLYEENGLN